MSSRLILVRSAESPSLTRLSHEIMVSMFNDDTNAIQRWLEDPTTHIEDGEKTKKQTALIWCARKGSHECLQLLLDAGANVNATMVAGATATYVATQENQERCVLLMVKYKADVTQGRSDTGATPLYCATQQGNIKIMDLLIEAGAHVNAALKNGTTSLFVAAEKGRTDSMSKLIDLGANVNISNKETGVTAVYIASQQGHVECLEQLIAAKADVNVPRDTGVTALYIASRQGHDQCVSILIGAGADVNITKDKKEAGASAIYIAASEGHYECLKMLLDARANVNSARENGMSALFMAAKQGFAKCLKILLDRGANCNATIDSHLGESALYKAAQHGHKECVQILVDADCNVHTSMTDGTTALWCAAQNGCVVCVKLLLEAKASPDVIRNTDGTSATQLVVHQGFTKVAQLLTADNNTNTNNNRRVVRNVENHPVNGRLQGEVIRAIDHDNGSNVQRWVRDRNTHLEDTEPDGVQNTALTRGAAKGSSKSVQILIDAGANVNARTASGATGLIVATKLGFLGIMHQLLAAGANISLLTDIGASALLLATESGRPDCMDVLIKAGANVNTCRKDGVQVLQITAMQGRPHCMDLLLQGGATVNASAKDKTSALGVATTLGKEDCVRLLLQAGANVDVLTLLRRTQEKVPEISIVSSSNSGPTISEELSNAQTQTKKQILCVPLYNACVKGYDAVVRLLLDKNADVNASIPGDHPLQGHTSLIATAIHHHTSCMQQLLLAKANLDMQLPDGHTAVCLAGSKHRLDCLKLLIAAEANLDLPRHDGSTPLIVTVHTADIGIADHVECASALIRAGSNVNVATKSGNTVLHVAAKKGAPSFVQLLLGAGSQMDAVTNNGRTPLMFAIDRMDCAIVKKATEKDSVAVPKHNQCVALLLRAGSNVDIAMPDGTTALHIAAEKGNTDLLQQIIQRGCNLDSLTVEFSTAVLLAAKGDFPVAVQLLLQSKADPMVKRNNGTTALHFVAQHGHVGLCDSILSTGVNVNTKAHDNATPLLLAASEGRLECVQLLLSKGCEDAVFNPEGQRLESIRGFTSLDFAIERGHEELISVLRNAGGCAPCKEPKSIVGKVIDIEEFGKAKVVNIRGSSTFFGIGLAANTDDLNSEYMVEFAGKKKEAVRLLRGNNNGLNYTIEGVLQGPEFEVSDETFENNAIPVHGGAVEAACNIDTVSENVAVEVLKLDNDGNDSFVRDSSFQLALENKDPETIANLMADSSGPKLRAEDFARAAELLDKKEMMWLKSQQQKEQECAVEHGKISRSLNELEQRMEELRTERSILKSRDSVEKECASCHRELASLNNRVAQAREKEKVGRQKLSNHEQELHAVEMQERQTQDEIDTKVKMIQVKQHDISLAGDTLHEMAQTLTSLGEIIDNVTSIKATENSEVSRKARSLVQNAQDNAKEANQALGNIKAKLEELSKIQRALGECRTTMNEIRQNRAQKQQETNDASEVHRTLLGNVDDLKKLSDEYVEKQSGALKGMETMQGHEDKVEEITLVLQHCVQRSEELEQAKLQAEIKLDTAKGATKKAMEQMEWTDRRVTFFLDGSTGDSKEFAREVLSILAEAPLSLKIQRSGMIALKEICKDRDVARFVNSQNGQQILLFNAFRDLLEDEVTKSPIKDLRHMLSNSRLNAISVALDELSIATKTQNLPQILATLSNPVVRTEVDVQGPGVEKFAQLLGVDAAAAEQAASSDLFSDVEVVLMHAKNSTDAGLKTAGEAAFALVHAVRQIQSSNRLSEVLESLQLQDPKPSLLVIGTSKLKADHSLIVNAQVSELQNARQEIAKALDESATVILPDCVLSTEGNTEIKVSDALTDMLGLIEVTEWVASTDKAHDGWVVKFLPKLIEHGITNLERAKERIEESGDLREWGVTKQPAKDLFVALQQY